MGVLLLAPGTLYPSHRHPAVEIYCALDGEAEWWREGEGWRRLPPGSLIHHPSGIAHAMRAGALPLIALYLWRGDLATTAVLTQ
jgi:quercetin dioxygenase-like cupin family protein